ncbi:MAG: prepilin peptidase [Patescibacteria group bacterium]|uniref:Prepilin peptidase n=1 Tax=candidate division WWE3 bacterium TaxID=2053526 RepID=A0A955J215_UNCKA|nr:prepilin peptidase [candidate division WWE3 bacterium]
MLYLLSAGLFLALSFIFGLFWGSFLNVVADRLSRDEGFVKSRSYCESCKTTLNVKDLVPLFSYLSTKGYCRYCNVSLSYYYPISELLSGLMCAGLVYMFRDSLTVVTTIVALVYYFLFFSIYLAITLADLKYTLIPNKLVLWGLITVLSYRVLDTYIYLSNIYSQLHTSAFGPYLYKAGFFHTRLYSEFTDFGLDALTGLGISAFFLLLIILTKGKGMGGGDVKLVFLIGLFNGFPNALVAIVFGFMLGAFISSILLLLRIKSFKDAIPFGPFLILGSLLSWLYGTSFLNWYLNFL